MQFDLNFENTVYPSWADYSYGWKSLAKLLVDPLNTQYFRHYTYKWYEMGYSKVTTNFELIDGPFGNGIIRKDKRPMTDAKNEHSWLPSVLLRAEASPSLPPGLPRFDSDYRVSYLSPKPSDEERLGLKKHKNDPMPSFSVESWPGMEHSVFVCFGLAGTARITADLREFPLWLRAWEIKAELIEGEVPAAAAVVEKFFTKWNLKGVWYFVGPVGYDAGLFLAMLVYLGGYLRSRMPRLKSVHMITTLPAEVRMCDKWNTQRLR